MIYNIIGLSFGLIGVVLLYRFGILPDNLWNHLLMDSGMEEKDERRHRIWSKIAVVLIFIGFAFQFIAALNQYSFHSDTEKLDNLFLGKQINLTSNIEGDVKLKYQNNTLYYQIELVGLNSSFDSVKAFGVYLEDSEGFKIKEIWETKNNSNPNLTRLHRNDSLIMTIKNTIPFSSENYSQINKWNLTITK